MVQCEDPCWCVGQQLLVGFKGAGGTNFEKARDTAAELVEELQRGSDVNVVLMSDPKTPLYDTSVFNADAVAEELRAMQAGFGQAQVSTALEHGAEQLPT